MPKPSLTHILCLAALLYAAPLATAQKSYKDLTYPPLNTLEVPNVERVTLDNGLLLFLVEDHELPVINFSARIGVGAINDLAGKTGLAGLAGNVMRTGGTKTMSGDQIDQTLESIGASIETRIGRTSGSASGSALKEDFGTVLPILADLLQNPAFPEDKLELAKVQTRSGISRRNDNAQQIAFREFDKLIYGADSPFVAQPEYATIDSVTTEDLASFHAAYFHPNNTLLGIWGDFDTAEMIETIKSAFGDWPMAEGFTRPEKPEVKYTFDSGVGHIQKDDVNQSVVLLGHIGGKRDNPDYFALQVMNNILGGGFSGRLFQNVRDQKGLAYSVFGEYDSNYDYPGTFYAGVMTKSESTVEAAKAVLEEIEGMRSRPITDEELSLAKESFLNAFVFNFDTRSEVINRLMTYEYYGYPADFLQQTKTQIEQVTKADVERVAQKYLRPDSVRILVVGKAENFDAPLTTLGPVTPIDVTIPAPGKPLPPPNAAMLEKGKMVLAEAIEATGGKALYESLESVQHKGQMTVPQMAGPPAKITLTIMNPGKLRLDIGTPTGDISQILVGEQAFLEVPGRTAEGPPAIVNQLQSTLWQNITYLLANVDSVQAQYLRAEVLDSLSADVVLITPSSGAPFRLYLDTTTHLPIQVNADAGGSTTGAVFSDFRDIGGLQVPFVSTLTRGEQPAGSLTYEEVQINIAVADSVFIAKPQELDGAEEKEEEKKPDN